MPRILSVMIAMMAVLVPSVAQAYVGPGAGVTAIGAAIGLIAAIGLALWAVIAYPLRRARKQKKEAAEAAAQNTTDKSAAE